MTFMRVSTCCFCIELKIGALILSAVFFWQSIGHLFIVLSAYDDSKILTILSGIMSSMEIVASIFLFSAVMGHNQTLMCCAALLLAAMAAVTYLNAVNEIFDSYEYRFKRGTPGLRFLFEFVRASCILHHSRSIYSLWRRMHDKENEKHEEYI